MLRIAHPLAPAVCRSQDAGCIIQPSCSSGYDVSLGLEPIHRSIDRLPSCTPGRPEFRTRLSRGTRLVYIGDPLDHLETSSFARPPRDRRYCSETPWGEWRRGSQIMNVKLIGGPRHIPYRCDTVHILHICVGYCMKLGPEGQAGRPEVTGAKELKIAAEKWRGIFA